MFKIVKHKKYKNMYYVQWPDGVLSESFYNVDWAKNHVLVLSTPEIGV
jgi:hypothetical protein